MSSPGAATRRLFFALWLPPDIAARLFATTQALAGGSNRAVAAVDLHVTLCFLGAVDESACAMLCERAAALQVQAFELEFDTIVHWRRARVLAATSAQVPGAATELVSALRASACELGLRPASQPFAPHVTLLRGVGRAAAAAGTLPKSLPLSPPVRLPGRSFDLAQSHALESATATTDAAPALRYARLASWPLRPASD